MTRREARETFDTPTRVRLVEDDLDQFAEALTGLKTELSALRAVLVGVLVSVTTAAIMLAISIVVNVGGT